MTAKEYLRQLWRLEQNIKILTDEIEERRTRLESITVPELGDKVQASPDGDRFADMIAILADKDMHRKELVFEYECLYDRIVDQIMELPNDLYGRVLYLYYVKRIPFKDIADQLYYSVKYIYDLHASALEQFEQYHGKIFRNM